MKLLKEVKILGKTFKVEYLDFDRRVQHNGMSGNVSYVNQIIQIDLKSHKETQESTLLHEIIHAVTDSLKLDLAEVVVQQIEAGLYQVFKDNDLFKK